MNYYNWKQDSKENIYNSDTEEETLVVKFVGTPEQLDALEVELKRLIKLLEISMS